MAKLRKRGGRLAFNAGYRAALITARPDLHALNGSFQREMRELHRDY